MKTKPWRDIRARKFSPKKLKEIDRAVEDELLEMDLKNSARPPARHKNN